MFTPSVSEAYEKIAEKRYVGKMWGKKIEKPV